MNDLSLGVDITGNAGGLNAALQSGAKGVQEFTGTVEASGKATVTAEGMATTALNAKAEAMRKAGTASTAAGTAAREAAKGVDALGVSAKQTSAAMRMLPAQLTDVVVQLQGGANPFTVLLQQGGQVKDSFGGVVPAARAMLGAITPAIAGFTALAVAGSMTALAWYQGRQEAQEYSKALILTGNAANTTADQMADEARAIAQLVGTQGKAAEALTAMASTGLVARSEMTRAAQTAVQMERALGVSVQDTADKFAALGREPLQASVRLNQGVNYLTAAVYEQIRALLAQGKTSEAAAVAQNAFADAMLARTGQIAKNLGTLEKAWKAVSDGAKEAWDSMVGLGREKTLEERLQAVEERIKRSTYARRMGINPLGNANDDAERDTLRESMRMRDRAAREQAAAKEKADRDLLRSETAYQAAAAAMARSGAVMRNAQTLTGLTEWQSVVERFHREDLIDAKEYQDALYLLESNRLDAEEALIRSKYSARASIKPKGEVEAMQQAADLQAIKAEITALEQKRSKLEDDEKSGRRDVAPKSRTTGPTDDLRAVNNALRAAETAAIRERTMEQLAAEAQLVAANKATAIQLIRDDRERGMAQIAAEEEVLRRRLDIQSQTVEEQKRLTEELATWRVQREKQLTEELKPEWQKQLEAWRDTARLMRDTQNNVANASLREGEAAWMQWAQTGKLSVKSVGDAIQAEVARGAYRSFVSAAAQFIGSYFGGGGGGETTSNFSTAAGISGGRAAGGPVEAGQDYWVGERGPERVRIGNRGGSVIPNHALGGGGDLTVNIINQTGTQADARVSRRSDGGIDVLLTAVKESIAGDILTGAGAVPQAMQNRYGLRASLTF